MSVFLNGKSSIDKVISAMSVEDKARLLTGATVFSSHGIDKFGIPQVIYYDCASGINLLQHAWEASSVLLNANSNRQQDDEITEGYGSVLPSLEGMVDAISMLDKGIFSDDLNENERKIADYVKERLPNGKLPTCFPAGIALGASWDQDLVYYAGTAVGKEAAAFGLDILLGSPTINIQRDPRNGRLFECYSEDPYHVSALAPRLVQGVQDQNVGANIKHFAANNQETYRQGVDEHISERALREIYFPAFKACIEKSDPKTLMSAYNRINGVPCSMNKWLLTDVLRDEWGFNGYVISDWGGSYQQALAFEAGNDIDMPGPRNLQPIINAVNDGTLNEEVLNTSCHRFLSVVVDLMEYRKNRAADFSIEESTKAAYEIASSSITLLKNDKVLPLEAGKKISFWGDKSKRFLSSGEGSAVVITDRFSSMTEQAIAINGNANVQFNCVEDDTDLVVITVSKTSAEGSDHDDIDLTVEDKIVLGTALTQAKAKKKQAMLIINSGGPLDISEYIEDLSAVMWVYYPGQEGGRVAADIIFGHVNPSGKLPLSYPRRLEDIPSFGNFPGNSGQVWYGEGIFVGYRWYEKRNIAPLFAFGHGLSYTKFDIHSLRINSNQIDLDAGSVIEGSVKVKNIGHRSGKEVVQIYVSQNKPILMKPVKELKYFKKVTLQPGEEKELFFTLRKEDLSSFDDTYHEWVTEPGKYSIMAGNSTDCIFCTETFSASGHCAYDFGPDTSMGTLLKRQDAAEVLIQNLKDHLSMESIEATLNFTPTLDLKTVWESSLRRRLESQDADANQIYETICIELKKLNIAQA